METEIADSIQRRISTFDKDQLIIQKMQVSRLYMIVNTIRDDIDKIKDSHTRLVKS